MTGWETMSKFYPAQSLSELQEAIKPDLALWEPWHIDHQERRVMYDSPSEGHCEHWSGYTVLFKRRVEEMI